ncbi:MAG: hypothetical protein M1812_002137 [Candelaria pacifica]|nr:MAG: hypothetical protein M1812_002137 [Candelaria pacifica]
MAKHPDTFSELGVEYQTVSWSSQASVKSLPKLHSLELGSLVRKPVQFDPSGRPVVSRDFSPDWVGRLIYDNASQLRRLKLGTESCLINSYIENGGGLDHPTQAKTFRKLYANMGGPNEEAQLQSVDGVPKAVITPLCLNSLHLIGLDVSLTLSESFPRIFKFAPLETFYLESCVGSEDLLESLAVSFGSTSIDHAPKIKDFRFRHEESGSILHDALGKFLSSFSGLQSLAILLDGTRDMPHPRCFTHKHGDTLKTLVWDGRSGARTDFGVRTAILASETFVHSQLTYISENCPGLVELGVSIDWRHTYQGVVPSIRNLKLLRTLNIRNVPECPEESIGSPPPILPTEQYARIAATQLMESTVEFEGIVAVPRPIPCSVKLITTGAITYRNHRTVLPVDDDEDLDEELHKYLSPRFFLIKYHPDALGHMKPLLTEVGMGTSYGVEAFEQNLSIFQPYWLN